MDLLFFEIVKAIGKMFLNPLLYWLLFISLLISYKRVKDERLQFTKELFPLGAEFNQTIFITLFGSISVSFVMILANTLFINEIILFLSIIIFILTFTTGFRLLAASYSLGLTFVLFKILEAFNNRLIIDGLISNHTFSSIALLIALFLLIEASMYRRIKNERSFPEIVKSKRGSWFGIYHVQKASFVPFLVFVPGDLTISSVTIFPYLTIGGEQVSFALIPFITGFHHIISGQLPESVGKKLSKNNLLLGLIVLVISLSSFYLPGLAFFAVSIALFGKILIEYLMTKHDRESGLYFLHLNKPLKVFHIVANSPASELGFRVGDMITKVNNQSINTIDELNEILANKLIYPTFEVISDNHEVRKITNTKFKGNYLSLGLIFAVEVNKRS